MNRVDNRGSSLWTFDTAPSPSDQIPSTYEMRQHWNIHHGSKDTIGLEDGMFGIAEVPTTKPTAIVSLDLCEIIRESGPSLTRIYGDMDSISDYGKYYGDGILGFRAQHAREYLLPELMNHDLVTPVPYTEVISELLQRWRQHGVYTVANSSTLPG